MKNAAVCLITGAIVLTICILIIGLYDMLGLQKWTFVIMLVVMLMYGKEASNRKQEIDRQHYTIPNQRPKDKHCGKI